MPIQKNRARVKEREFGGNQYHIGCWQEQEMGAK